jgi:hypothetical protein
VPLWVYVNDDSVCSGSIGQDYIQIFETPCTLSYDTTLT